MRWKAEVGEKGARAWVCDAFDGTRQFSVPVWAVDMLVQDHNELLRLKEAALTGSGAWIPIGERLPVKAEDQLVLVFSPERTQEGDRCWAATSAALHSDDWKERYRVTHWQPLPQPPMNSGSQS